MTEQSGDMTAAFSTALAAADSTPVAEASPASTPTPEQTPAESPAPAATTQAAETTPAPESVTTDDQKKQTRLPDGSFAPPEERWPDILENQRRKAAEDAETRVRAEVAKEYEGLNDFAGMSPEERAGLVTWNKALNGDAHALAIVAQAQPQLAQSLGWTPTADPEPEPDVQTTDGTPMYSAAQQAKRDEWLIAKVMQSVRKELSPLQTVADTFRDREARAKADMEVRDILAEFRRKDPDFEAHRKEVGAEIAKDAELKALSNRDPKLAVELAWARVERATVRPVQQATSEQRVVANIQQRAVAATVNPNAAHASAPKKFAQGEQGFAEALAHFGAGAR